MATTNEQTKRSDVMRKGRTSSILLRENNLEHFYFNKGDVVMGLFDYHCKGLELSLDLACD